MKKETRAVSPLACKLGSIIGLPGCAISCTVFFGLTFLGLLGAAGVGVFNTLFAPDKAFMAAGGRLTTQPIILPTVNTLIVFVSAALAVFGSSVGGKRFLLPATVAAAIMLSGFVLLPRPIVMKTAKMLAENPVFPFEVTPALLLFWVGFVALYVFAIGAHSGKLRRLYRLK